MRIGIMATTFLNKGFQTWGNKTYDKLKEIGYNCTDFCIANTDHIIYNGSEEEARDFLLKEKELAQKAGIEIFQVHGPWRWPARDFEEEDRTERMEKMKRSIWATSVLGVKYWVVHPIMPFGVEEVDTEDAKKTWELNIVFMKELLKTAKKYGVTICLENMPMHKFSISTPEMILKFVKEMNDENFKICLDTGHVNVFPGLKVGDEVRKLGDEIKVFHIHDNTFERDLHQIPYFGNIDWDDFAKSLKDINYDGVFSLEISLPSALPQYIFEEQMVSILNVAKEIAQKAE